MSFHNIRMMDSDERLEDDPQKKPKTIHCEDNLDIKKNFYVYSDCFLERSQLKLQIVESVIVIVIDKIDLLLKFKNTSQPFIQMLYFYRIENVEEQNQYSKSLEHPV